jgi:hypothetical protein
MVLMTVSFPKTFSESGEINDRGPPVKRAV